MRDDVRPDSVFVAKYDRGLNVLTEPRYNRRHRHRLRPNYVRLERA